MTTVITLVHFVRSGYLLKLGYAVLCGQDFPYWAYKLAESMWNAINLNMAQV